MHCAASPTTMTLTRPIGSHAEGVYEGHHSAFVDAGPTYDAVPPRPSTGHSYHGPGNGAAQAGNAAAGEAHPAGTTGAAYHAGAAGQEYHAGTAVAEHHAEATGTVASIYDSSTVGATAALTPATGATGASPSVQQYAATSVGSRPGAVGAGQVGTVGVTGAYSTSKEPVGEASATPVTAAAGRLRMGDSLWIFAAVVLAIFY